jgi:superfamily II helicase
MVNLKRDFFIVLDRERTENTDIIYNVNFFYLKSLKKRGKQSFSYISKPFFKGIVILGLDFKNKIRPLKFDKILKDGNLKPVDPKLFKKFVLADENKYIAFSTESREEDKEPIRQMLQSFQVKEDKIISLTFCNSCLDQRKFKILDKGHQIKSFKNQVVCPSCALDIVLRHAKGRHLLTSKRIEPKLKHFFRHLILKFKNIKKVIDSFKPGFNPESNKEVTLYDVERNTPVSKKYLNYKVVDLKVPNALKKLLKDLNIHTLLPIQAISVDRGLLREYKNQLIMAPTSGGKTLVGEIAGVSKLLKDKRDKMLYLVPIVALANIRELEFKSNFLYFSLNSNSLMFAKATIGTK